MKPNLLLYFTIICLLVSCVLLKRTKNTKDEKKEIAELETNQQNENHNKPLFKSFSSSRSFVYSNINGKETTNFDGLDLEKKGFEKGEKVIEEKYGRTIHKKNKNSLKIKEQASSSDEMENLVLGESPVEYELNGDSEKQFLEKDPFFGNIEKNFLGFGMNGMNKVRKNLPQMKLENSFNSDFFNNSPIKVGFEMMQNSEDLFDQFMNKQAKKKSKNNKKIGKNSEKNHVENNNIHHNQVHDEKIQQTSEIKNNKL